MTREGDRIELLEPIGALAAGQRGTVYQISMSSAVRVEWDNGAKSWIRPGWASWKVLVRLPSKDMTQEHPAPPEEE